MIKKIITSILLTISIVAYGNDVKSISKYVFPQNVPSSPVEYVYMPDGLTYLTLNNNGKSIVKYDIKTGKEIETVIDVAKTRGAKIDAIEGFELSQDGSKLLVYTDKQMIYRRSFKASYYVYEIKRNMLVALSENFTHQQAPVFSPDARVVAFVVDNNIYLKKLDYNTEIAVTTDGKINEVINGVPDWVYEEEFTTNNSMTWSPDNMTLCFIKYNEKSVKDYTMQLYKGSCNPKRQYEFYPGEFKYKYPVAGEVNSVVSVHSYDVETRKIKKVALPDDRIEYIPRIAYGHDATRLIVTTLNREQNRMEIYAANPKSTVVKSIYVEESDSWIAPETYETIKYYPDYFILNSDKDGYSHIYQYSYSGNLMRKVTSGQYEVTDFYGFDNLGNAYFQSTITGELNRVVSKLDRKGNIVHLSDEQGTASAVFSPAMNYAMLNYSNITTPPVYKIIDIKGKEIRVLEDNASYAATYKSVPQKEFFKVKSNGIELNGVMLKPADFDTSKKYPVIMTQYSGPGSQQVRNRWQMDWEYYAVTQGFIVVCVDGRGTGFRGNEFERVVYKQLGYYETIDQLAAAKHVSSLSYVDSKRIGICGWSYGGYETLMAISHKQSPFAAAVAIAPVTDWRYYDTIYAERYMLTPQSNEEGYNAGSPIKLAKNVSCPLLLMSGTADDNVHFQNTIEYVSQLQSNGILCDMLIFPNMNHSINHCNARSLVYAKMIDYFKRNM
ncbi:MAG: DPP IV N-terminal domain-containing protein [Muribaculaceae bacterium]|nr:DPP IV N-terminal domain-containing protein [Muribaculaceae bacterium]